MSEVTIYELEDVDAKGAHVVACFPSVGLVATIGANFLIEELKLKQVGIMDGPDFPTLSVVHAGEPLNPVRIYAGGYRDRDGKERRLVVFLSEFQPNPDLVRPVADAIMTWAKEKGAAAVVSPEGLVMEGEAAEDNIVDVYTIGSTAAMRKLLEEHGAPLFEDGIVAGVTGVLMNLGKREDFDVIGILSEAATEFPDARSAATVIELLGQLVNVEVDVSSLYDEASQFEEHVQDLAKRQRLSEQTIEKVQSGQNPMFG